MPISFGSLGVGANGSRFLGDIDADRAPGDATPAADAARGAELVDPACKLVRDPLPVARAPALAYAAAVQIGEIQREAGIPFADALGRRTCEVAVILDGGAEAGRADHGAIAAGKAALGDVDPARMVRVRLQQVLDAVGVERSAHLAACPLRHGCCR